MARGQKISIDKKVAGFRCIAVVAVINVQGEVVAMQMEEGSINTEKFTEFLKSLFRLYKG